MSDDDDRLSEWLKWKKKKTWYENPRASTAPTEDELRGMVRAQLKALSMSADEAATQHGLDRNTIRRMLGGRSPRYPVLRKICDAVSLDLTVTPPGESLPGPRLAGAETTASTAGAAQPTPFRSRAPSETELREMIRKRLEEQDLSARSAALLRRLSPDAINSVLRGQSPRYSMLRKICAALELDLIIIPDGDPLPERVRFARFSATRDLPVRRYRRTAGGWALDDSTSQQAPAPADLDDPQAFYVVAPPDKTMTPVNIDPGDYCLVSPVTEVESLPTPIWLHRSDEREALYILLLDWGDYGLDVINWMNTGERLDPPVVHAEYIPDAEFVCVARILAVYREVPAVGNPPTRWWPKWAASVNPQSRPEQ